MARFQDIPAGLCHNCGTCVAVCPPKALSTGAERPALTGACDGCGLCVDFCPGLRVDLFNLNRSLFPSKVSDIYFGCYEEMLLGRGLGDSPPTVSSGGVVTAVLSAALEAGLVEAAAVVGMNPAAPWEARVSVARSAEEVRGAAGSKYSLVPVNSALAQTSALDGPVAYVGLPCHLHGIRMLQEAGHPLAANVSCAVGLFCGFNLLPGAVPFLLGKMGIAPGEVKRVCYREGDWPGSFVVETVDGRKESLPKLAFNFLHLLFLPRRCTLCPDLFAEAADVSVGDYWHAAAGRKALSSVIVRNERGRALLENARARGRVELAPLDPADLYRSHAHLVKYKKRALFTRVRLSRPAPELAVKKPHLFPLEKLEAALFLAALRVGGLRLSRAMAHFVPLGLLGKAARAARGGGKKGSGRGRLQLRPRYWTLAEVGRHWDHTDEYDDVNLKTYSYGRRFVDGFRLAAGRIPEGAEVLDVSCRTGKGSLYFGSRKRMRLTGLAPSPLQVGTAGRRLKEGGIPFTAFEWTGMRLPFPDGSFDFVLSFETIEHVFQYEDFIGELSRVLREGGGLLLTTPNLLWDPLHTLAHRLRLHHSEGPHRFLWRSEIVRALESRGFVIDEEVSAVLFAYGPAWLTALGVAIERRTPEAIRRRLCLRRIMLCRKGNSAGGAAG